MTPFVFVCCVLAVWRISRFSRKESGPGNALSRLRNHFIGDDPADGSIADFMSCNKCQSVWISLAILPMVYQTPGSVAVSVLMLMAIIHLGVMSWLSPNWCGWVCKFSAMCFAYLIGLTIFTAWYSDAMPSLYMPFAVSGATFFVEHLDNWNDRMADLFIDQEIEDEDPNNPIGLP